MASALSDQDFQRIQVHRMSYYFCYLFNFFLGGGEVENFIIPLSDLGEEYGSGCFATKKRIRPLMKIRIWVDPTQKSGSDLKIS